MISKDKFKKVWMVLYFLMVLMVSFTAFHSPFIAVNYTKFILLNAFILWASSFYLLGFKRIKIWWKDNWAAAKKRADMRKAIEEDLKKRGF